MPSSKWFKLIAGVRLAFRQAMTKRGGRKYFLKLSLVFVFQSVKLLPAFLRFSGKFRQPFNPNKQTVALTKIFLSISWKRFLTTNLRKSVYQKPLEISANGFGQQR